MQTIRLSTFTMNQLPNLAPEPQPLLLIADADPQSPIPASYTNQVSRWLDTHFPNKVLLVMADDEVITSCCEHDLTVDKQHTACCTHTLEQRYWLISEATWAKHGATIRNIDATWRHSRDRCLIATQASTRNPETSSTLPSDV